MGKILRCSAALEPPGYFEWYTVSVQLNADYKAADGEPGAEDTAREWFAEILGRLARDEVKFAAYSVDASGPLKLTLIPGTDENEWLKRISPYPLNCQSPAPIDIAKEIHEWLGKNSAHWAADPPTQGDYGDKLPAAKLLAGSEGWMSPVPQCAGLTQVFELGEHHDSPFYVVPQWGEEKPRNPIYLKPEGLGTPDENNSPLADADRLIIDVPVERCELIGTTDAPDQSLLIGDDGFVVPAPEAERVFGLFARIREAGGSSLWTASQLLEVNWPHPPEIELRQKRLVWRALNGAVTILDPVLAALLMPGSDREGPFVAALIAARDPDEKIISDDVKLKEDEDTVKDLKTKLRGFTQLWETDRDALARDLASILQLDLTAARADLDRSPKQVGSPQLPSLPDALSALLVVYRDGMKADDLARWVLSDEGSLEQLEKQLSAELREMFARFQGEAGVEDAVVAIIDRAAANPKDVPDPNWTEAFRRFKQSLAEEFDGHTAAGQAIGGLVQRDVLRATKPAPKQPPTEQEINDTLRRAAWFTDRLGLTSGGSLSTLAEGLPVVALQLLDEPAKKKLTENLHKAFDAVADAIITGQDPAVRFVPDAAPRPLPVMIAIDQDLTDDGFSQRYDGVCLLIRRDEREQEWAHANLAKIVEPSVSEHLSLIAARPVASDGFSQMFVEYSGEPFAWEMTPAKGQGAQPFIKFAAPAKDDLDSMARLPALAYGKDYQVAAFAVSRSGALPAGIAGEDRWLPRPDMKLPKLSISEPFPYRRRTAIAGATLKFEEDKPAGVQPLSWDYPRLGCVSPAAGDPRHIDLWRLATGEGLIEVPISPPLVLADIRLWGAMGSLKLELYRISKNRGEYIEEAIAVWNVRAEKPLEGRIELKFDRDKDGQPNATVTIMPDKGWSVDEPATVPIESAARIWLRLTVEAAAADPLALSLTDLRAEQLAGKDSGRLILLAPDDSGWSRPTSQRITIGAPCMSLADFDRWVWNPKLKESVGDASPDLKQSPILQLLCKLHAAHQSGQMLDKAIPEVSVSGLLVELCPLDSLDEAADVERKLHRVIDLEPLGAALRDVWTKPLPAILMHLESIYSFVLTVGSGKKFELKKGDPGSETLIALIPSGGNARISVRPLVNRRYFEDGDLQAFNPRYLDLQQGEYGERLIFEGPAITAEVMMRCPDFWRDQPKADDFLAIRAGADVRAYDLVWRGREANLERKWRHFGEAEVTTQRWRYLGRPIYRWFRPRDFAVRRDEDDTLSKPDEGAVLRLSPVGKEAAPKTIGAIVDFEKDAFLGRSSRDDGVRQIAVLRPLGSDTVLQCFPWEQPSATMFRHRVRLISRYAAMMPAPEDGGWDVYSDDSTAGDWLRTIVLAEPVKAQLTRPRLRALMPLSVPTDEEVRTPPVLAILEEPPMNVGGLAERIGAEVRTGLGYAFREKEEAGRSSTELQLGVEDARKEFGPDPRYSYFPTPEDVDRALSLAAEGPMGLTYEPDVPSPAFPHSALLLTPCFLHPDAAAHDAQEHFLSIGLRRYLDPDWVAGRQLATNGAAAAPNDSAAPIWIKVSQGVTLTVTDGSKTSDFIEVRRDGKRWTIAVPAEWLMSETSLKGPICLASIDAGSVDHLGLLHQPLEEGRFTMSIFAVRKEDGSPANGAAHPMMLASFDWRAGAEGAVLDLEKLETVRVGASPVTAMNWTRTRRNSMIVFARDEEGKTDPFNAKELVVRTHTNPQGQELILTHGDKELWPRMAPMETKTPLYVHRHLAILVSEISGYGGRPLEIHQDARLVLGRNLPIAVADQLRQVRFVELEVPARPLGAGLPDPFTEEFGRAVFDLAAIKENAAEPGAFMISIRPLGTARKLKAGWTMSFELTDPRGTSSASIAPSLTEDRSVEQVVVRWGPNGKGDCILVWADGQTSSATIELELDPDSLGLTAVSIADVRIPGVEAGEWWADISMLVLPDEADVSGNIPLCWDWLFTGGTDVPADALTHDALRRMVEAQARIVTVSAPIVIERSA